jgi:serine/threonine protein kinase
MDDESDDFSVFGLDDSSTSATSVSASESEGDVLPLNSSTKEEDETQGDSKNLFVLKRKYCDSLAAANASLQEAITMVRCLSDYVVAYEDVFLEPREEYGVKYFYLCLVMDYCRGGNLAEWIGGNPLDSVGEEDEFEDTHLRLRFARQLLQGMADVHRIGLAHRDIKGENILLQDEESTKTNLMLGDFGLAVGSSRRSQAEKRSDVAGTPLYMAPEVQDRSEYDTKADIWSLGCVLLELATSRMLPFCLADRAREEGADWDPASLLKDVPQRLAVLNQLITRMLVVDPADRPKAEVLLQTRGLHGSDDRSDDTPLFGRTDSASSVRSCGRFQSGIVGEEGAEVMRRELARADWPQAIELLAQNNLIDERFPYFDNAEMVDVARQLMWPTLLEHTFKYGSVWGMWSGTPQRLTGVAVWLRPDTPKKPPLKKVLLMMARGVRRFPRSVVKKTVKDFKNMKGLSGALQTATNCEKQWTLHTIVIVPEEQRKALGTQLRWRRCFRGPTTLALRARSRAVLRLKKISLNLSDSRCCVV